MPSWLLAAGIALWLPWATASAALGPGLRAQAGPATTLGVDASPELDLETLETRLRETRAIGLFTKLSLRNQVDDLVEAFRRFHHGEGGGPLSRLYGQFDLLVMKILSLLQDDDPTLAREIVASRDALWQMLADPRTFANTPT